MAEKINVDVHIVGEGTQKTAPIFDNNVYEKTLNNMRQLFSGGKRDLDELIASRTKTYSEEKRKVESRTGSEALKEVQSKYRINLDDNAASTSEKRANEKIDVKEFLKAEKQAVAVINAKIKALNDFVKENASAITQEYKKIDYTATVNQKEFRDAKKFKLGEIIGTSQGSYTTKAKLGGRSFSKLTESNKISSERLEAEATRKKEEEKAKEWLEVEKETIEHRAVDPGFARAKEYFLEKKGYLITQDKKKRKQIIANPKKFLKKEDQKAYENAERDYLVEFGYAEKVGQANSIIANINAARSKGIVDSNSIEKLINTYIDEGIVKNKIAETSSGPSGNKNEVYAYTQPATEYEGKVYGARAGIGVKSEDVDKTLTKMTEGNSVLATTIKGIPNIQNLLRSTPEGGHSFGSLEKLVELLQGLKSGGLNKVETEKVDSYINSIISGIEKAYSFSKEGSKGENIAIQRLEHTLFGGKKADTSLSEHEIVWGEHNEKKISYTRDGALASNLRERGKVFNPFLDENEIEKNPEFYRDDFAPTTKKDKETDEQVESKNIQNNRESDGKKNFFSREIMGALKTDSEEMKKMFAGLFEDTNIEKAKQVVTYIRELFKTLNDNENSHFEPGEKGVSSLVFHPELTGEHKTEEERNKEEDDKAAREYEAQNKVLEGANEPNLVKQLKQGIISYLKEAETQVPRGQNDVLNSISYVLKELEGHNVAGERRESDPVADANKAIQNFASLLSKHKSIKFERDMRAEATGMTKKDVNLSLKNQNPEGYEEALISQGAYKKFSGFMEQGMSYKEAMLATIPTLNDPKNTFSPLLDLEDKDWEASVLKEFEHQLTPGAKKDKKNIEEEQREKTAARDSAKSDLRQAVNSGKSTVKEIESLERKALAAQKALDEFYDANGLNYAPSAYKDSYPREKMEGLTPKERHQLTVQGIGVTSFYAGDTIDEKIDNAKALLETSDETIPLNSTELEAKARAQSALPEVIEKYKNAMEKLAEHFRLVEGQLTLEGANPIGDEAKILRGDIEKTYGDLHASPLGSEERRALERKLLSQLKDYGDFAEENDLDFERKSFNKAIFSALDASSELKDTEEAAYREERPKMNEAQKDIIKRDIALMEEQKKIEQQTKEDYEVSRHRAGSMDIMRLAERGKKIARRREEKEAKRQVEEEENAVQEDHTSSEEKTEPKKKKQTTKKRSPRNKSTKDSNKPPKEVTTSTSAEAISSDETSENATVTPKEAVPLASETKGFETVNESIRAHNELLKESIKLEQQKAEVSEKLQGALSEEAQGFKDAGKASKEHGKADANASVAINSNIATTAGITAPGEEEAYNGPVAFEPDKDFIKNHKYWVYGTDQTVKADTSSTAVASTINPYIPKNGKSTGDGASYLAEKLGSVDLNNISAIDATFMGMSQEDFDAFKRNYLKTTQGNVGHKLIELANQGKGPNSREFSKYLKKEENVLRKMGYDDEQISGIKDRAVHSLENQDLIYGEILGRKKSGKSERPKYNEITLGTMVGGETVAATLDQLHIDSAGNATIIDNKFKDKIGATEAIQLSIQENAVKQYAEAAKKWKAALDKAPDGADRTQVMMDLINNQGLDASMVDFFEANQKTAKDFARINTDSIRTYVAQHKSDGSSHAIGVNTMGAEEISKMYSAAKNGEILDEQAQDLLISKSYRSAGGVHVEEEPTGKLLGKKEALARSKSENNSSVENVEAEIVATERFNKLLERRIELEVQLQGLLNSPMGDSEKREGRMAAVLATQEEIKSLGQVMDEDELKAVSKATSEYSKGKAFKKKVGEYAASVAAGDSPKLTEGTKKRMGKTTRKSGAGDNIEDEVSSYPKLLSLMRERLKLEGKLYEAQKLNDNIAQEEINKELMANSIAIENTAATQGVNRTEAFGLYDEYKSSVEGQYEIRKDSSKTTAKAQEDLRKNILSAYKAYEEANLNTIYAEGKTKDQYLGEGERRLAQERYEQSTAYASKKKDEYESLMGQINTLPEGERQRLMKDIDDIRAKYSMLGKTAQIETFRQKGFFQQLKLGFKQSLRNLLDYQAAYTVIGYMKQGFRMTIQTAKELDAALVNLQIATNGTRTEAEALMNTYYGIADEMGRTASEVSAAANDWLRAGYDGQQAAELTKASMALSTLGMIESSQATEYLVSQLKGWKMSTEDVMSSVDKLTALDAAAAITAGDLAEGMSRANVSAQMAGSSYDKFAAYITTVADVTQKSASSIGESFKTMYARYGNVKLGKWTPTKEDETSEDFDASNFENLNDIETALSKVGINYRNAVNEVRDFDEVVAEIAGKWETLDKVSQNAIASALGGTRQRENILVLFENWDKVGQFETIASNSVGTASEKMEAHNESLAASANRVTNAFQEWVAAKGPVIEILKSFNEALVALIKNLDGLITIGGIAALVGFGPELMAGAGKWGAKLNNISADGLKGIGEKYKGRFEGAKKEIIDEDNYLKNVRKKDQPLIKAQDENTVATRENTQGQDRVITALDRTTSALNRLGGQPTPNSPSPIPSGDGVISPIKKRKIGSPSTPSVPYTASPSSLGNFSPRHGSLPSVGVTPSEITTKRKIGGPSTLPTAYSKKSGESAYKAIPKTNPPSSSPSATSLAIRGGASIIGSTLGAIGGSGLGAKIAKASGGDEGTGAIIGATVGGVAGQIAAAIPGPWGAIASVGVGVVTTVADQILGAEERNAERIRKETKELESEIEAGTASLAEIEADSFKKRFEELSAGVDSEGRNLTLSDEDYSEYRNMVDKLLELNPQLIKAYDAEGQALIERNSLLEDSIRLLKEENAEKKREKYEGEKWDQLVQDTYDDIWKGKGSIEETLSEKEQKALGYKEFYDDQGSKGKAIVGEDGKVYTGYLSTRTTLNPLSTPKKGDYVDNYGNEYVKKGDYYFRVNTKTGELIENESFTEAYESGKKKEKGIFKEREIQQKEFQKLMNEKATTLYDYENLDETGKNIINSLTQNMRLSGNSKTDMKAEVAKYVEDLQDTIYFLNENPQIFSEGVEIVGADKQKKTLKLEDFYEVDSTMSSSDAAEMRKKFIESVLANLGEKDQEKALDLAVALNLIPTDEQGNPLGGVEFKNGKWVVTGSTDSQDTANYKRLLDGANIDYSGWGTLTEQEFKWASENTDLVKNKGAEEVKRMVQTYAPEALEVGIDTKFDTEGISKLKSGLEDLGGAIKQFKEDGFVSSDNLDKLQEVYTEAGLSITDMNNALLDANGAYSLGQEQVDKYVRALISKDIASKKLTPELIKQRNAELELIGVYGYEKEALSKAVNGLYEYKEGVGLVERTDLTDQERQLLEMARAAGILGATKKPIEDIVNVLKMSGASDSVIKSMLDSANASGRSLLDTLTMIIKLVGGLGSTNINANMSEGLRWMNNTKDEHSWNEGYALYKKGLIEAGLATEKTSYEETLQMIRMANSGLYGDLKGILENSGSSTSYVSTNSNTLAGVTPEEQADKARDIAKKQKEISRKEEEIEKKIKENRLELFKDEIEAIDLLIKANEALNSVYEAQLSTLSSNNHRQKLDIMASQYALNQEQLNTYQEQYDKLMAYEPETPEGKLWKAEILETINNSMLETKKTMISARKEAENMRLEMIKLSLNNNLDYLNREVEILDRRLKNLVSDDNWIDFDAIYGVTLLPNLNDFNIKEDVGLDYTEESNKIKKLTDMKLEAAREVAEEEAKLREREVEDAKEDLEDMRIELQKLNKELYGKNPSSSGGSTGSGGGTPNQVQNQGKDIVRKIQEKLNQELGANLAVDGIAGELTNKAYADYLKKKGKGGRGYTSDAEAYKELYGTDYVAPQSGGENTPTTPTETTYNIKPIYLAPTKKQQEEIATVIKGQVEEINKSLDKISVLLPISKGDAGDGDSIESLVESSITKIKDILSTTDTQTKISEGITKSLTLAKAAVEVISAQMADKMAGAFHSDTVTKAIGALTTDVNNLIKKDGPFDKLKTVLKEIEKLTDIDFDGTDWGKQLGTIVEDLKKIKDKLQIANTGGADGVGGPGAVHHSTSQSGFQYPLTLTGGRKDGKFGLTSQYGWRIHPIQKYRKLHTGVDIGAGFGTDVLAAKDGTVILSGWNGGYGKCVIIQHEDGYQTLYAHMSSLYTKSGQTVKRGAHIGEVGSTGNSTGPHLHLELRKNGSPVDPDGILEYYSGTPDSSSRAKELMLIGETYQDEIIGYKDGRREVVNTPTIRDRKDVEYVVGVEDTKKISYATGSPMANEKYLKEIKEACDVFNIPYELALSVIDQESGNEWAYNSKSGATGFMQLTHWVTGDMKETPSITSKLEEHGVDYNNARTNNEDLAWRDNLWTGIANIRLLKDRYYGGDSNFRNVLKHYGPSGLGYGYADEVLARSEESAFKQAAAKLKGDGGTIPAETLPSAAEVAKKYIGQDNSDLKFSNGVDQEWCADFVTYVAKEAGWDAFKNTDKNTSWVPDLIEMAKEAGTYRTYDSSDPNTLPKANDVIFTRGDKHTGIVTRVEDGKVYFIAGNDKDPADSKYKVREDSAPLTDSNISFGTFTSSGVTGKPILSEKEKVTNIQTKLKNDYKKDLGTYGPNSDGIDGTAGAKTKQAFKEATGKDWTNVDDAYSFLFPEPTSAKGFLKALDTSQEKFKKLEQIIDNVVKIFNDAGVKINKSDVIAALGAISSFGTAEDAINGHPEKGVGIGMLTKADVENIYNDSLLAKLLNDNNIDKGSILTSGDPYMSEDLLTTQVWAAVAKMGLTGSDVGFDPEKTLNAFGAKLFTDLGTQIINPPKENNSVSDSKETNSPKDKVESYLADWVKDLKHVQSDGTVKMFGIDDVEALKKLLIPDNTSPATKQEEYETAFSRLIKVNSSVISTTNSDIKKLWEAAQNTDDIDILYGIYDIISEEESKRDAAQEAINNAISEYAENMMKLLDKESGKIVSAINNSTYSIKKLEDSLSKNVLPFGKASTLSMIAGDYAGQAASYKHKENAAREVNETAKDRMRSLLSEIPEDIFDVNGKKIDFERLVNAIDDTGEINETEKIFIQDALNLLNRDGVISEDFQAKLLGSFSLVAASQKEMVEAENEQTEAYKSSADAMERAYQSIAESNQLQEAWNIDKPLGIYEYNLGLWDNVVGWADTGVEKIAANSLKSDFLEGKYTAVTDAMTFVDKEIKDMQATLLFNQKLDTSDYMEFIDPITGSIDKKGIYDELLGGKDESTQQAILTSIEEIGRLSSKYTDLQKNAVSIMGEQINTQKLILQSAAELMNVEIKIDEVKLGITKGFNDWTNKFTSYRNDVRKELRSAKQSSQYLDATTRSLVFNEADYKYLLDTIDTLEAKMSSTYDDYRDAIEGLTEDTLWKEEFITAEYEERLELIEQEYNLAKATVDLNKKQQKLNNTLAEKNVRMLIDGEWRYVANPNDVNAAQQEYDDALANKEASEKEVKDKKEENMLSSNLRDKKEKQKELQVRSEKTGELGDEFTTALTGVMGTTKDWNNTHKAISSLLTTAENIYKHMAPGGKIESNYFQGDDIDTRALTNTSDEKGESHIESNKLKDIASQLKQTEIGTPDWDYTLKRYKAAYSTATQRGELFSQFGSEAKAKAYLKSQGIYEWEEVFEEDIASKINQQKRYIANLKSEGKDTKEAEKKLADLEATRDRKLVTLASFDKFGYDDTALVRRMEALRKEFTTQYKEGNIQEAEWIANEYNNLYNSMVKHGRKGYLNKGPINFDSTKGLDETWIAYIEALRNAKSEEDRQDIYNALRGFTEDFDFKGAYNLRKLEFSNKEHPLYSDNYSKAMLELMEPLKGEKEAYIDKNGNFIGKIKKGNEKDYETLEWLRNQKIAYLGLNQNFTEKGKILESQDGFRELMFGEHLYQKERELYAIPLAKQYYSDYLFNPRDTKAGYEAAQKHNRLSKSYKFLNIPLISGFSEDKNYAERMLALMDPLEGDEKAYVDEEGNFIGKIKEGKEEKFAQYANERNRLIAFKGLDAIFTDETGKATESKRKEILGEDYYNYQKQWMQEAPKIEKAYKEALTKYFTGDWESAKAANKIIADSFGGSPIGPVDYWFPGPDSGFNLMEDNWAEHMVKTTDSHAKQNFAENRILKMFLEKKDAQILAGTFKSDDAIFKEIAKDDFFASQGFQLTGELVEGVIDRISGKFDIYELYSKGKAQKELNAYADTSSSKEIRETNRKNFNDRVDAFYGTSGFPKGIKLPEDWEKEDFLGRALELGTDHKDYWTLIYNEILKRFLKGASLKELANDFVPDKENREEAIEDVKRIIERQTGNLDWSAVAGMNLPMLFDLYRNNEEGTYEHDQAQKAINRILNLANLDGNSSIFEGWMLPYEDLFKTDWAKEMQELKGTRLYDEMSKEEQEQYGTYRLNRVIKMILDPSSTHGYLKKGEHYDEFGNLTEEGMELVATLNDVTKEELDAFMKSKLGVEDWTGALRKAFLAQEGFSQTISSSGEGISAGLANVAGSSTTTAGALGGLANAANAASGALSKIASNSENKATENSNTSPKTTTNSSNVSTTSTNRVTYGNAWYDLDEKGNIVRTSDETVAKQTGATYVKAATGATIFDGGLVNHSELGAELLIPASGYIDAMQYGSTIVPRQQAENIMKWGTLNPGDFKTPEISSNLIDNSLSQQISIGTIQLTEVQKFDDFLPAMNSFLKRTVPVTRER